MSMVATHDSFPVNRDTLVEIVLEAFDMVQTLRFGHGEATQHYGKDFNLGGGTIGSIFELCFAKSLIRRFPSTWRRGISKCEKDFVHKFNPSLSFEMKTSSSSSGIFGSRQYIHGSGGVKNRNGWLLAINYKKSPPAMVTKIRVGIVHDSDWRASESKYCQSSYLPKEFLSNEMSVYYTSTQ